VTAYGQDLMAADTAPARDAVASRQKNQQSRLATRRNDSSRSCWRMRPAALLM
jgi:hypothetical protein